MSNSIGVSESDMITTIQTLSKLDALHSLQLQNVTIPKIDFNSTQPKIIE